ncbi:hypothetical protein D3C71_1843910 [compost metagenome]
METSPWEGLVLEFVSKKVPLDWSKRSLSECKAFWTLQQGNEDIELTDRDRICAAEVWVECLNNDIKHMKINDAKEINSILNAIPGFERSLPLRFGAYGNQRGFIKKVT